MEKQKRWQFWLIIAVLAVTVYSILPTIFWYSKPLNQEIGPERAKQVAMQAVERVNSLEQEAVDWIHSYSGNLGIKPKSVEVDEDSPRFIYVRFDAERDARVFARFFNAAGSGISFVPAQLQLARNNAKDIPRENGLYSITVERNIGIRLDPDNVDNLFTFSKKMTEDRDIVPFYRDLVYSRVVEVAKGVVGPSLQAKKAAAIVELPKDQRLNDFGVALAKEINNITQTFGADSPIAGRYFASYTLIDKPNKSEFIQQFTAKLQSIKDEIEKELDKLSVEEEAIQEKGELVDISTTQRKNLYQRQIRSLGEAIATLEKNRQQFASGKTPLTPEGILAVLEESEKTIDRRDYIQIVDLSNYHPFISNLYIDWTDDVVKLRFYPDVQNILNPENTSEAAALAREEANRQIFNSIATISRTSGEDFSPDGVDFALRLNTLTNSSSLLALNLGKIAEMQAAQVVEAIDQTWTPEHKELQKNVFPVRGYEEYLKESPEDRQFGLVIYAPGADDRAPEEGFDPNAIYVIIRGFDRMDEKIRENPESRPSLMLSQDLAALRNILTRNGFLEFPSNTYELSPDFQNDLIFIQSNYYNDIIAATRENFTVKGDEKYAVLEFTNVEQRILTQNNIADRKQEELVKWQEAYNAAQVDLAAARRYTVPPPTQNPYIQNFFLSAKKYFRGDDRQILKWGLDLSGGKTVRIGLRDQDNRPVTNPEDLNQAVNELYTRINKMGVSERTIRTENETIILDFPGSQAFSATELIKASAMYFHIVNEKFGLNNRELAPIVNEFLQEVWNEAVVTNRQDSESINDIAWRHLGGDPVNPEAMIPKSENAQILYDHGLRLANPHVDRRTPAFNDSLSKIARYQGDDLTEWHHQTHPLLIVFNNFALEGSGLTNVRVGFDQKDGYVLHFEVKGSYDVKRNQDYGSPRQDLYTWTSQFAEERIEGTPKAAYAPSGYRMAVILNGRVVSNPVLRAALSNNGTISGNFTPREINQLAADLKAGSLSFTPQILSEHNVSPELGKDERARGILASIIALILVFTTMIGVYRFAGVVASCAVLINLLIMWGIFQNVGIALTLPGIAGVVLTIGMAVDANVLVFERIREEFSVSGRIATAIHAGYKKAYSAIIDSNITTLMAAFILIQFDSGPIKGFAVVLIIGILSSMFTTLFMTRYFFAGWVQNPKNKALNMAKIFRDTKINFLKYTRPAVVISIIVVVAGTYLLIEERNTIFGMDFTGGYSLTLDLDEVPDTQYRTEATNALIAAGATQGDVQIRELSRPNQLRIQLGISMEEPGRPFYGMPLENDRGNFTYAFERNPRIAWVVDSLAAAGLDVQEVQLTSLETNWSVMSGQLSDTMRNNAILAMTIALIGILLYITFRFEFKYAVAAVIALAHDVWITLGIVALFHLLGFPIEINLQAIGAIMTIIGYSLNDTIIVFDRIREEVRVLRKLKFTEVINHSLNVTLNRTIMTSGTTLLVLLSLVFLGGPSIFGFSLIMTIGVLVGTISSLFIASPTLLWVHNQMRKKEGLPAEI
jgi:SecD/SecF fusion protein